MQSGDPVHATAHDGGVVMVESSKLLPLLIALTVISMAFAAFAFAFAFKTEQGITYRVDFLQQRVETSIKEAKQVQIQLMYANAIFLREGLVKPGDMVYGPEGNLQFRAIEIGKPKEK